jgi:cytochrome b subunit of formate dehydrogenase
MSDSDRSYPRFSLGQRIQHGVLVLSFTLLAVSGLPQKYATTSVGEAAIRVLGGIEAVRVLHRLAAVVLTCAALFHGFDVAWRVFVLRRPLAMLPGVRDLRDAVATVRHNLWRSAPRPRAGRYSFEEKLEYWALVWGTVVMIVTGFVLWNPVAAATLLPGQAIPASLAAHGGEAVLAVLAVIVWHGYGVHVRHFNRSMLTGSMTEAEMRAEHPLELEELESGLGPAPPEPKALRQRRRLFLPAALVLGVLLLAALYRFLTFEQTAIPTLPRQGPPAASSRAEHPAWGSQDRRLLVSQRAFLAGWRPRFVGKVRRFRAARPGTSLVGLFER